VIVRVTVVMAVVAVLIDPVSPSPEPPPVARSRRQRDGVVAAG